MAKSSTVTLESYLRTRERISPDLVTVMEQVAHAVKRISNELSRAALKDELGYTGEVNVHGEEVEKLDAWSDKVFAEALSTDGPVCTLVSEEIDEPRHREGRCAHKSYVLMYDPLDGSSNTDVNGSLGSIFALRQRHPGHTAEIGDLLAAGTEQILAGYALYGPATMLVWTAGAGVSAFVLDRATGKFLLWRDRLSMPKRGKSYAVNQANSAKWHPGARALLEVLTGPKDEGGGYSLRYSGAFVADFHRCLLKGGIFLYPGEVSAEGRSAGKLRLMYEVAPLAMLAEQAGGAAWIGRQRALDFVPAKVHERVPVYIGSAEEVALAERLHAEG